MRHLLLGAQWGLLRLIDTWMQRARWGRGGAGLGWAWQVAGFTAAPTAPSKSGLAAFPEQAFPGCGHMSPRDLGWLTLCPCRRNLPV